MNTFKTIAGVTLFVGIALGLIFIEPDLSTTIVIFLMFCAIMFLSGIHYKIITGVLIVSLPFICILGYYVTQPGNVILKGYQYLSLIHILNTIQNPGESVIRGISMIMSDSRYKKLMYEPRESSF